MNQLSAWKRTNKPLDRPADGGIAGGLRMAELQADCGFFASLKITNCVMFLLKQELQIRFWRGNVGHPIVLKTTCLICNFFAKRVLMLYNKVGFEIRAIVS